MGKTEIIESIIRNAEKAAEETVQEAYAEAEEALRRLNAQLEERERRQSAQADADAAELVKRRITAAELEARKITLAARQDVLKDAYDKAYKLLSDMKPAAYKDFIAVLIRAYAAPGDTVTVCARDKDVINAEFLKGFRLDLKLSGARGSFDGGIMLSNEIAEKNLTFGALIKEARDKGEPEIVGLLFKK